MRWYWRLRASNDSVAATVFPRSWRPSSVPPAPGQGALAIQVRRGDAEVHALVAAIDDPATRLAVTAEREVLRATGGGCRAPIGAFATVEDGRVTILAGAVDPSGAGRAFVTGAGPSDSVLDVARSLGERLLELVTADGTGARLTPPRPRPMPTPRST